MLKDKIDMMLDYIKAHQEYLALNHKLLDVHEGNLLPYVDDVLKKTLSPQYYDVVKERIVPINILQKLIGKLSKAYDDGPARIAENDEVSQELMDAYVSTANMNAYLDSSDRYANLHKGFALEPYYSKGAPKLRAIPFDRFLVISEDIEDPTEPTIFIKFMGEIASSSEIKDNALFYAYSDTEFVAFTGGGEIYTPAMEENEGINPYGRIPFVYGNRSLLNLLPTQETDLFPMSRIAPLILSDMSGAMVFQMFSVVYGIDINIEGAVWSPNGLWSIKSDPQSDKQPSLGILKPEADTEKVVSYIKNILAFWFDTKGLSTSGIGDIDGGNFASGISKVIDEMDASSYIKKSMEFFTGIERELWDLIAVVHNYAVDRGDLKNVPLFPSTFEPTIIFADPEPQTTRKEEVETVKLEVESGFMPRDAGIKQLYPELEGDSFDKWVEAIDADQSIVISNEDNADTEIESD